MGAHACGGEENALIHWWNRWVDLVARREPGHAAAAVRITTGLTVFAHLWRQWDTETWRWVWLPPEAGGLVGVSHGVLDRFGGARSDNVGSLLVIGMCSSLALAVGVATPVAAAVSALAWGVLSNLGVNAGGSYDFLGDNLLFLLIFAGAGQVASVDAWVGRRLGRAPAAVWCWPRWLMVWQLVVMYDTTVWQKLSSGWVPGGSLDALWYILQQPTWHRTDMRWLAPYYPLTQLATLGTWCFEQASPLILLAAWYRHTRSRSGWVRAQFNRIDVRFWMLCLGVALHLGIEATMEVGAFTPLTLALYLACFSGDEVRRLFSQEGAAAR